MRSQSMFCIGNYIYIYFLSRGDSSTATELYLRLYWYVFESYNGFFINILVHLITVSIFLCSCMLYNIIVVYSSSWYLVLYLTCAWVVPPLCNCHICICINLFVNVILIVTAIFLCNSYDLILGCATYRESCHAYFLYIICCSIVAILIDLHSK